MIPCLSANRNAYLCPVFIFSLSTKIFIANWRSFNIIMNFQFILYIIYTDKIVCFVAYVDECGDPVWLWCLSKSLEHHNKKRASFLSLQKKKGFSLWMGRITSDVGFRLVWRVLNITAVSAWNGTDCQALNRNAKKCKRGYYVGLLRKQYIIIFSFFLFQPK